VKRGLNTGKGRGVGKRREIQVFGRGPNGVEAAIDVIGVEVKKEQRS